MKHRVAKFVALLILAVLSAAGYITYQSSQRLIDVGFNRIDPFIQVNPDKTYELTVWVTSAPLPWDEESRRAAFTEAIEQFESVWPNISVTTDYVSLQDGKTRMNEALVQGHPPDIFDMTMGITILSDTWQVPVDAYMSDDSKDDFLPVLTRSLSTDGHMWAWPRWILTRHWVMRNDIDADLDESKHDWTTDAMIDQLRATKEKTGVQSIVLNALDATLLADVMIASTGKTVIDQQGNRAWSEDELAQGLRFFRRLIDEGLTEKHAASMARSRLSKFWNKEAAIIAPVAPALMHHLLTRGGVVPSGNGRDGRGFISPMLPPSFDRRTVGKYVPAVTAGFAVFTRDPYPGDDHTKAAMLLAEHLSRRLGPAEATDIFAVPVHPSALDWWRQRSGLPNKEANLLLTWADAAVISPADEVSALVERRVMEEVIGPKLVELWEGRSAEEVAHDIVTDIDGLQAVAKPATGSLIHLQ